MPRTSYGLRRSSSSPASFFSDLDVLEAIVQQKISPPIPQKKFVSQPENRSVKFPKSGDLRLKSAENVASGENDHAS